MKTGNCVPTLIAVANGDRESISLSTNPQFMAIIERSRARQAAEGGIPIEEVRRRLGLPKSLRRP